MNRKVLKLITILICLTMVVTLLPDFNTYALASENEKSIVSENRQDPYVYDSIDNVIITRKNVPRTIPKEIGAYDLDKYPITQVNIVPDEATFNLIKEENKKLMDQVEEDIANGTLNIIS